MKDGNEKMIEEMTGLGDVVRATFLRDAFHAWGRGEASGLGRRLCLVELGLRRFGGRWRGSAAAWISAP